MKIIAHRGASKKCEENTIGAFLWASRMRAHGIEFDIQITSDNVLVTKHDTYDKNTGILTYNSKYEARKHTTLDDVFFTTNGKFETYIFDIKDVRPNSNIVSEIFLCVSRHNIDLESCIFTSFNEFHLRDICRIENDYNIKIPKAYTTANMDIDMLESKKIKWGINYAVLYKFQINKDFIDKLKTMDIKVYSYTCNTIGIIEYCRNIGCYGIITDCPDII